jgi:hypothetical protein
MNSLNLDGEESKACGWCFVDGRKSEKKNVTIVTSRWMWGRFSGGRGCVRNLGQLYQILETGGLW